MKFTRVCKLKLKKKEFLLYKDKMYVPKVKLLILDEIHKTPYSGHPSYQKTITMC